MVLGARRGCRRAQLSARRRARLRRRQGDSGAAEYGRRRLEHMRRAGVAVGREALLGDIRASPALRAVKISGRGARDARAGAVRDLRRIPGGVAQRYARRRGLDGARDPRRRRVRVRVG